jgi:hypothetical protein
MRVVGRVSCVLGLAFVVFGGATQAAPPKGAAGANSREVLERAVTQQPGNPAAHLALGKSYAAAGLRAAAILAYLRSLSLDSESAQAVTAAQAVRGMLTQGVSEGKDGGIQIAISEPSEENPLSMIDLSLSLTAATRHLDESKGKTEIQLIAESLNTVFSIAAESGLKSQAGCFPCRQYLPFFLDLKDKSLLEPFLYVAMSSLHLPGSSEWLAAHTAKVDDLKKWLASKPAS